MTKEEIAKEIAETIFNIGEAGEVDIEEAILDTLTEILHADKGKLTKGTLT